MAKEKSKKSKHSEKQKKHSGSGSFLALDKKIAMFFQKGWSVPLLFAVVSIGYFAQFVFTDTAIFSSDAGIMGKPVSGLSSVVNPFAETGFWHHAMMGGHPTSQSLPQYVYYIFYNLFLVFFTGYRSVALYFSLLSFGAGCFMFLYIRSLNIRREIAVIAGLFYMSSPMLLSFVLAGHTSKMGVITLLPLMFFFLEKAFSTQKFKYFLFLGGSMSLAIGTAHLQYAYFSFWAIGFYFLYKIAQIYLTEKNITKVARNTGLFTFAVLIGLAISARGYIPQYVHTSTVSKRAITEEEIQPGAPSSFEYAASWSLNPEEIGSLLLPHFSNYNSEYWGRNASKQNSEYFGLYPFLLFFAGLLLWRTEKKVRFFTFLFSFAVLFALGANTPFFKLIYYVIPGVKSFRAPSIISFLFSFSGAVVMALFLEKMLVRKPQKGEKHSQTGEIQFKRTKLFFYGSFTVAALLMILSKPILSVWESLFSMSEVWGPNADILRQRMVNNASAISMDAFIMLILCGILFLLLIAYRNNKIGLATIMIVIGIVAVADTWRVNGDFQRDVAYDSIPPVESREIPALENLKELDRSPYRIFSEYAFQPGGAGLKYSYPGHLMTHGFLDFTMKRFDRVQAAFVDNLTQNRSISFPILNLLNTKYYITTVQNNIENLLLKVVSGQLFVYENSAMFPYFDFVHSYRVIENEDEILTTLVSPGFQSDREVIVEIDPPSFALTGIDGAQEPPLQDEIEYVGVKDFYINPQSEFQFRVNSEQAGFVVLSDNYHPQWKATVDGVETEIYRANYLWKGVFVPAGQHNVVFTFVPLVIQYSRLTSFLGMLLFGILLVLTFVLDRRSSKTADSI